ncbi:MAG: hypothetical protein ACREPQ_06095 [Rhodanobacter sp.]
MLTKQGFAIMVNRRWMKAVTALVLAVSLGMAQAQDTGVSGFFHRAGAAIKQGTTSVLHGGSSGAQVDATGIAVTTGDIYKPLSPASGGEFVGLFNGAHHGQLWPRAALTFLSYGATLPCWTIRATIWRSPISHHDETFQICHAPIMTTDAVGNQTEITGGFNQVWMRRNSPGITHVQSSPARTTGPNPPDQFFMVPLTDHLLEVQYKNILMRAAWVSGSINHANPSTDDGQFNLMWTAGFDPAGNHDRPH